MANLFADLAVGKHVVWERQHFYGGWVLLRVIAVRAKRFDTDRGAAGVGRFTFRRADGRSVGNPKHVFFVRPVTPAEAKEWTRGIPLPDPQHSRDGGGE